MPKERIIDERTGRLCDYAALVDECRTLVQTEGVTWRQAAERIAKSASCDKAESIVRQLNRKRPEDEKQPPSFLPGEAVLYDAIAQQLDALELAVNSLVGRQAILAQKDDRFRVLAEASASIRALLHYRLEILQSLSDEESARIADDVLHGMQQGQLSPNTLIQMEHGRLSSLITRVRQLQHKIDDARPGPYIIQDY